MCSDEGVGGYLQHRCILPEKAPCLHYHNRKLHTNTPAQYKLTVLLAQKCIHNACQTPNVKSVNSVNSDQLRQLGQQRQRSELGQKRQLLQLGQQLVSRSQTLRESGCVTLVNSYNSVKSDNSVNSVSSDNDNSFNSVNSDALLSTHYIGQLGGHFLK